MESSGIANLKKVPVIVRKVDDKKSLVLSLIENIQREDLNAVEEAQAINKLISIIICPINRRQRHLVSQKRNNKCIKASNIRQKNT